MPWALFDVASNRRSELEEALHDDVVSRQSQKVRDAGLMGGPAGHFYILVEGSPEAVSRAETLLRSIGTQLPPGEGEALYRRLKDEDEAASAGMGLFFTD